MSGAAIATERDMADRAAALLLREARLLDAEAYDDWLELFTDDVHYWMPSTESRYRAGSDASPTRMAFFDDTKDDLRIRVRRFQAPTAWSEDPPTRHVHVVTNIETFPTDAADTYDVHSVVAAHRSRGEDDNTVTLARRADSVVDTPDGLRIRRRHIFTPGVVLQSRNLNTFL